MFFNVTVGLVSVIEISLVMRMAYMISPAIVTCSIFGNFHASSNIQAFFTFFLFSLKLSTEAFEIERCSRLLMSTKPAVCCATDIHARYITHHLPHISRITRSPRELMIQKKTKLSRDLLRRTRRLSAMHELLWIIVQNAALRNAEHHISTWEQCKYLSTLAINTVNPWKDGCTDQPGWARL